ncbi:MULTISPECIES: DUF4922 domain-containing protein [Megasphaera]|uniref:DUF4922 domain-containing protein n=1 Tax=Megasphaera TaxID=906 RepID=UPI001D098B56|nr:DUF4922 domain-containing protein [Megasphaera massiliensis]MCB6386454.1 DUF4922 domain-containing protein [Megasphaera massiliensis]MCB6400527.1 DUF4922 domain-containing protein [Megasphaera massiliensis]MCB6404822.1 DUF4922 domain-containing protein [Megasphaera massiliensis]MCB7349558.1 DUF4922 domain-containing protein [Megasphaera massiliensis]
MLIRQTPIAEIRNTFLCNTKIPPSSVTLKYREKYICIWLYFIMKNHLFVKNKLHSPTRKSSFFQKSMSLSKERHAFHHC